MKCPLNGFSKCNLDCALIVKVTCESIEDNSYACGLASIATKKEWPIFFSVANLVKVVKEEGENICK